MVRDDVYLILCFLSISETSREMEINILLTLFGKLRFHNTENKKKI